MPRVETLPMGVAAEGVAALYGSKAKPTSPLLLQEGEGALALQTTVLPIIMVKMALPPTMAVAAEATTPLAMLLEERADKMDMVALAEEKDGFPSFKTQQGNLQRPMAEMGAMAVAVAVAQAAAAIPCMQLELEEAIQGVELGEQPIIMAAAVAGPTTPAATSQALAVSKMGMGRLSLRGNDNLCSLGRFNNKGAHPIVMKFLVSILG